MKTPHPLQVAMPWGSGPTRTIQFRILSGAGYRTPRHGAFKLMKRLGIPLVLYEDETAHRGEGKRLWRPGDQYPTALTFCSEYLEPGPDGVAESMRRLVVGSHVFLIRYRGAPGEWRSNVGGDYEVLSYSEVSRHDDLIRWPMYAIDSVHGHAIDLNYAPGLPLECINWPGVGRYTLRDSVQKHWENYRRER